MKKSLFLIAAILVIISSGCQKIKDLANINVDIPYSQQVNVPAVSGYNYGVALPAGGVSLPFPALPLATNSKQYISQYNTSTDKVLNVDLKSLALQIQSPAGQNFDFLDSVQIYISAASQPEVLIAYQYNIAKGQTTLTLNTLDSINLKNYFIQDTMYFRMNAHINAVPPTGTQLNISSVFHMLANPLD